jgi:hypothetical protein
LFLQSDYPILGAIQRLCRTNSNAFSALAAKLDHRIFLHGQDRDPNGGPVPVNDLEKGLGASLFAQSTTHAKAGASR